MLYLETPAVRCHFETNKKDIPDMNHGIWLLMSGQDISCIIEGLLIHINNNSKETKMLAKLSCSNPFIIGTGRHH